MHFSSSFPPLKHRCGIYTCIRCWLDFLCTRNRMCPSCFILVVIGTNLTGKLLQGDMCIE